MKIEYIRNMQSGYMRLELTKPLSKTEEEMLTHNRIEGLLPLRWQQENDKYLLRYDITGKQALDAMVENTLVDEIMLRNLLIGIYVVVKQLEKYLLSQDGLLLSPEVIFWDYKTETMHFCYLPEIEGTLQTQLVKLMEYMLAKTDHKNVAAVQLAYGVYEAVQHPAFCMEDLQEYLQRRPTETIVYEPEREKEELYVEEQMNLQSFRTENAGVRKNSYKLILKEKIVAWIKEQVKKIRRDKRKEETVIYDMQNMLQEEAVTTILGGEREEIKGLLKYEGTNALPDIPIITVPFVIGSADSCDGVIRHPNVSRNHARITYRDNTYFIEDLNSTNGTRVNGGLLSYKTKVSLKKNETIYFANEPYRLL